MTAQRFQLKTLLAVSSLASGLMLAGCGGSSSAPAQVVGPTLGGVAASGAPIPDAAVTLTCGDGSTRATTTDVNGAYSISLAGCVAPFVVSVTGNIAGTQDTLVSVHATPPAAGETSVTVNVTPLTHALAATLASSGDPLDLVSNHAKEKANVTETAIKDRKDALVAALADALKTAGVTDPKFDPVNSKFKADRTGVDKLLDNLRVRPTTLKDGSKGVLITNVGDANKSDDMKDLAGSSAKPRDDLSGSAIALSKASKKTDFSTVKLPPALDDHSLADSIRDALNACFAQPFAQRGTFAAPSKLCKAVPIDGKYLHDGKDGAQEFDRFLANAKYDNARFDRPQIIRFYSSAKNDTRALAAFPLKRADGVVMTLITVVEQSTATGGVKELRGNQRPLKVAVTGFAEKRVQVEAKNSANPKSTFYTTGINLYVGFGEGGAGGSAPGAAASGRRIAYVKVTGPALPAGGVFLNPLLAGCDTFYAIASSASATPGACSSLFTLASRAATNTDFDNFSARYGKEPNFAAAKASDAQILAIQPNSAYRFEVWKVGNATAKPDYVFYERIRSRPLTMGELAAKRDGEIDKLRWNALSADTVAAIDPASGKAFTGGNPSSFLAKWTNQAQLPPVGNVLVQARPSGFAGTLYSDEIAVPFAAASARLSNGTQGWPDMGSTKGTLAGAYNLAELVSHNRFDLQLFAVWVY